MRGEGVRDEVHNLAQLFWLSQIEIFLELLMGLREGAEDEM